MSNEPDIIELRTAGPEELARPVLHAGAGVVLRDGRTWLVPAVAELPDHATAEELADVPEEDRAWSSILVAQDRRQLLSAAAYYAGVARQGGTLRWDDLRAFCGRLLRVNYRLPERHAFLLIDPPHALAVLSAALGFPLIPKQKATADG